MAAHRMVLGAALLLLAAGAHASDVWRCTAPDGGVSYQQFPCPASTHESAVPVRSAWPAVNTAERERVLRREAELLARLEAQRERLSREAIARQALASRENSTTEESSPPQYVIGWPVRPVKLLHRPTRPHPRARAR
jgi:hypothetical protein